MRPRLLFVVATLLAFLVFATTWLSPLLPVADTSVLEAFKDLTPLSRADAMLTSWMLAWGSHALRTDPLHLYHANVFHPLPWTFAFSENLIASAALMTPVDVVWQNPVLDHNVLLIASFVLAGAGTAFLLRELGAGLPAAWLAGAMVAFDPFRFGTIGHIHALSTHWMPFALLALHRCLRTGRGMIAVALTLLLVTLSSVYYAYFFLLALAVLVPAWWLFGPPAAPGGWRRALAGMAIAVAVTALVLRPYMIARDLYALARSSGEAWFFAGKGIHYLGAAVDPVGYAQRRYVAGEHVPTVIGLGMLVFMLVGLATGAPRERGGRRTTTAYLLVAVWLAVVSLGPLMQWENLLSPNYPGVWNALASVIPGFAALRVPMRACTVVVLAVAVIAGLGADALWRRTRGPVARGLLFAGFVAVGALESMRPPLHLTTVSWAAQGMPPVYRWLGQQPGRDAVLELPLGLPANDAEYMVLSSRHWKPLVNGYSGFAPTTGFFRGFLFTFPSPPTVRLLHQIGVRWVVVHPRDLGRGQAGLCANDSARLAPYMTIAYRDETSCVIEIRSAPPAPPPPNDRAVSLAGASVTASSGTDASAAIDGRLDTHWVEAVDQNKASWLQLDLPAAHAISRVVVQLGPHFGEYLRQWRIETSSDGVTWEQAGADRNAMPPLVQIRTDPRALTTELKLDRPLETQHLRIVRTPGDKQTAYDLWGNWSQWGVHELAVFEAGT
jgi:hypothetical protein